MFPSALVFFEVFTVTVAADLPRENHIPKDRIQPVLDLYEQGLYVQVFRQTESWGPIESWRGPEAIILGARMAANLGSIRMSAWLIRRAYRLHPDYAESHYYHAYTMFRTRGPYRTWRWMHEHDQLPGNPSGESLSSWYALFGEVSGVLRDFETAESWLRKADEAEPDNAWTPVCWSSVLEYEDRYEDALAAARRSLELRPWYRPGVQSLGHVLTLMERDDEALDLLSEAVNRLESGSLAAQLYALQIELKQYEEAGRTIDRMEQLMPMADKRTRQYIASQRAEIAYRRGDVDASIRFAEQSDDEFMKTIAERLKDPQRADAKVIELPVGFVRQHHSTCAPATLSAISRYWKMPADHLQVADEICYNGTTCYNERRWANDNGWATREFTVDESSASALLEQGIPFTFATVDPGSAHLQAVIGYDGRRGTLSIRDPFWRNANEAIADKVLERYAAYGPRGMALVPKEQQDKLDAIELPDAPLWDMAFEFDGALVAHKRDQAQTVLQQLQAAAPDHRLTLEVRRRLALYDSNPTEHLASIELLAERYPDNQSLQLERLSVLRDLARRDERLQTYEELCRKKEMHPIFWQQYAQELRADARRHEEAMILLNRALRKWPTEAGNYYVLANIYWDQRRFDEALELYRFAACLDDKEEQFAQGYFSASVCRQQTDKAMTYLQDRFVRFGKKSVLPARTLFYAYLQLERSKEALKVVEEALTLRPEDGELLLFAADAYLSCSAENMPRATELVEMAKEKSASSTWLRTAARLAAQDGRLTDALAIWRRLLERQPLAVDAHSAVARLLAETEGNDAALTHLEETADRFPHHHPLHELWIEWLRDEPAEVREPVIRRVIEATPDDAWLRRELALLLSSERRMAEAWRELEIAHELDPHSSSYHMVHYHLLRGEDRIDEAKQALREAIKISVDEDFAIGELMNLCYTVDERREVLAFVREELVKQVMFGDGLLAFRNHASDTLDPEELLADLQEALEARPDLWHAWSAVIWQLLDLNRLDEADELSRQAIERFPLVPRLWLDRSAVCQACKNDDGEFQALQTAHRINPAWGTATRTLCELYDRRGEFERTQQLLEQTIARDPLDAANHILLAESLWRLGEREEALDRVQHAVQLDPGFERGWDRLHAWADELECPERAIDTVRELTETRGGEARSWLMLARLLDEPDRLEERLAALDKAIDRNPRSVDAYDMRAVSFVREGRWDEALAECQPAVFGDKTPSALRARGAWIEAQRGDLKQAIEAMEAVVADEPQFFEAWLQLADWHQQLGDAKSYLQVAETMVRLRPQYEVSLGYLGEAKLVNEDRSGALEAFSRAFELAPAYEFAANSLFELLLEDDQLQAAAEVLAKMEKHIGGPFVGARAVQLAAKRSDISEAQQELARVCTTPCPSPWPVNVSVDAMIEAGWERAVRELLDQLLDAPEVQDDVGMQWGRLRGQLADRNCEGRLPELIGRGEIGNMATYGYIDGLLQAGKGAALKDFIRQNAEWLRAGDYTWGAAGFGLAGLREYGLALDWMKDWKQRQGAEPWMLVNTVEALRAAELDAEAVEASQRALDMPPAYGQHLHHIWLAADGVLSGELESANDHLNCTGGENLDTDYEFMVVLIESILELALAESGERAKAFAEIKQRFAKLRSLYEPYKEEPARRRFYRNCVALAAQIQGGFGAKLWAWFRLLKS